MPPPVISRGLDLFNRFILKQKTISQPGFGEESDPVDVYQKFCMSGLDYKGQVSSGYVANGVNIGLGAQVDILDIAALSSGIPVIPGFSLTAGPDIAASCKKETLIVLQRFPTWVYDRNVVHTSGGLAGVPPPASYVSFRPCFLTGLPVTSLVMDGKSVEGSFTLSASAGMGIPFSIDELGVSLEIGIWASLSGKIIGLKGLSPACFANITDLNLRGNLGDKLNSILIPEQKNSKRMLAMMKKISNRIKNGAPPSPPSYSPVDLFKLASFSGSLGSFGTANAGFSFPKVLDIDLAETIRAQAGAGVDVNLEAGLTGYRLQSTNPAGPFTLVSTQDTLITYRKLNANAGVFGTLGLKDYVKPGFDWTNYSMTYQSFGRYWRYPTTLKNEGGLRQRYPLLNGSGVSFGMSVNTKRLINCARNSANPSSSRLIACIAKQLRVHPKTVFDFISNQAAISDLAPDQKGLPEYVFLESNFAFPSGQTMTLEIDNGSWKPKNGFSEPEFLGFRQRLKQSFPDDTLTQNNWNTPVQPDPQLEAIRLRIRIADSNSSVRRLFKLGINRYIKTGISAELSFSTDTGQEALFDYYVHWYNNDQYNTDLRLAPSAQEFSVAPVVLLHQ